MTQEDIIELARQAGVRDDEHTFEFSQYKYLERFATLIAEHERNACAKVCESYFERVMASRIRTRGQA